MWRWLLLVLGCSLPLAGALAAQPVDCAGPVAQAQSAIDKVTGDLQGMEKMMPKSEMGQLNNLVEQAVRLNKEAQRNCTAKGSPYTRAQAIAQATAANGYATAADVLHFHYMSEPAAGTIDSGKNMGGMPSMGAGSQSK